MRAFLSLLLGNVVARGAEAAPYVIDFLPAPTPSGYMNSSMWSWGGGVVGPAADGKFHLFGSAFSGGCGLTSWGSNSFAHHSVADSPLGPFSFVGAALPFYSHNVQPVVAPDGTVLIFKIGMFPEPQPGKCGADGQPLQQQQQQKQPPPLQHGFETIECWFAPTVDGPFTPVPGGVNGRNLFNSTNPSPAFNPSGNGTIYVMGHDGGNMVVSTAPSWRGPYSAPVPVFSFLQDGYVGEDPLLWFDRSMGVWRCLYHMYNLTDHKVQFRVGGYAQSTTASIFSPWLVQPNETPAYTADLESYVSGDSGPTQTTTLSRRERPKLFFDAATGAPAVLYTGVCPPTSSSECFTSAAPIRAGALGRAPAAKLGAWPSVSITQYGAVGDNATDNTLAVRAALAAVAAAGGGEVVVPAGGVFKTGPLNLTSNVRLTVEGTLFSLEDSAAFPRVADLPSYDDMPPRCHPLVWAVDATNVSVAGTGVINGAGPYWWPNFANDTARPHLMEMYNVSGLSLTQVTMLNSGFWTLHVVYSTDVLIAGINITAPWCENYKCANDDGIDIDSTSNVLIENSYIACGDDHVTVISGANAKGRAFGMPSRNVTVRNNVLGTGMGLSIGSSVSGGVEDVVYEFNVMTEDATEWGQGCHLKTQALRGGYVRNVVWQHNVFNVVSSAGLEVETDYQGGQKDCDASNCTEIRDIVWRNLTFGAVGGPGSVDCFPQRPCVNLTFESVRVNSTGKWGCSNVASGSFVDVTPAGLQQACGL